MNELLPVISVISTVCAIVFGYAAFARNKKTDTADEAKADATDFTTRLTAVEESAKQAHHRLNRLEGITDRVEHADG